MTTRHLVDPELVAMLDQFPAVAFTDETLGQARAMTGSIPVAKHHKFTHISIENQQENQIHSRFGSPRLSSTP